MNERQVVITGAVVGALAGMAIAYAYFSPDGQRRRAELERGLRLLMQEAERLVSAADQVRQSVAELRGPQGGWPRTA